MKFRNMAILSLAIQLGISPFIAHPFDVYVFFASAQSIVMNGDVEQHMVPYRYSFFLFAVPGFLAYSLLDKVMPSFTISMSSLPNELRLSNLPWQIPIVPGLLFDFWMKLPLIISDVIVAYLIMKIVRKHTNDERIGLSAAALWLFNPLVIWVTAGWGTFDTLPALFTVIALYAVYERRHVFAGIALGIAFALKIYPLLLTIPLALLLYRRLGRDAAIRFAGSFTLVFIASTISSFLTWNSYLLELATSSKYMLSGPSYFGLTFWNFFSLILGINLNSVYVPIVLISLLASYYLLWRVSYGDLLVDLTFSFLVPIIAVLLFYPVVAENFLIWLLPFLSILVGLKRIGRGAVLLLSLVALVFNLANSLLPYYLLPIAPWVGNLLVTALSLVAPYRLAPQGVFHPGLGFGTILLTSLGLLAWLCMLFFYSRFVADAQHLGNYQIKSIDSIPNKE